jgi:polyphenol oxidase
MNRGFITLAIFKGLPVEAVFTTKFFHMEESNLKTKFHAEAVYMPIQKHTGKVITVDANLEPKIADAVITARRGLLIGIRVADCVPVLLYDRKQHVAGAVHAGWRGTAEGIVKKTIEVFKDRFYSSPEDIIVAIGPSIKGCCYEVGPEVIDAVKAGTGKGDYVSAHGEKRLVDLSAANKLQAVSEGILPENVWISEDCTHCLPERYYSYRFCRGTSDRQYGFIVIR